MAKNKFLQKRTMETHMVKQIQIQHIQQEIQCTYLLKSKIS